LQTRDALMFSMEYIEGMDLAEVVKKRGPLPAAQAASYVLQAARGLQHAFEKRVVHRDVKPENLILDGKKHTVKILDFGLAKATRTGTGEAVEGMTSLNMMMGTPDYMAPEQARDATNVDVRADIYSLGCTLYFLLTGRPPFDGGSLATKIAAHQLSEPNPVENLRQDLLAGLAEVVRKMMAKDPADRYQKPEEVVQALTTCLEAKQPTAKASSRNAVAALGRAVAPFAIGRLFVKFRARLARLLLFPP
jgi:serine/threonine protein kinase